MNSIDGFPIKHNGDDGDSMLWAGLMVAVGDTRPIAGIKKCQSEDGRLWRSPNRVNNQPTNSFSRDMSLGFILYFLKTQDHEMADKWIAYIKKTGGLFPSSESTDTRHIVTPTLWWLMSYVGMKVPFYWRWTRGLYKIYTRFELQFTPSGYERHLKAVSELILALVSKKRDKEFGRQLISQDPDNPFFAWLAGYYADEIEEMVQGMIELAAVKRNSDGSFGSGTQWAWEREDSEAAYLDSMGWDFEFVLELIKLEGIE